MLDAKGNTNDRGETGQGGGEVANRQPPAHHQKPDHVAREPQGTGTQIGWTSELPAADGLLAKGPKGEAADHKAGPSPGQANDRDDAEHTRQPPAQAHHQPAEHKPQNIQQKTQHGSVDSSATPPWCFGYVLIPLLTQLIRQ